MGRRSNIGVLLAFSLIANALCVPTSVLRIKRQSSETSGLTNASGTDDKEISNNVNFNQPPPASYSDDDDDGFPPYPENDTSGGGGSNLFSLLNLVTAFLPGSSSSNRAIQTLLKGIVKRNKPNIAIRRQAIRNNEIDIDYVGDLKPPPVLRQVVKNKIELENSKSESNESDENSSTQESLENDEDINKSNENSVEIEEDIDDDDDDDEPPGGGDDEGGGLLGVLAGLSGGEDGESDLGSLLATISGIVANLSGDGIDLNALIASGIGLFVGLLSEGEENPGEILASYLLTSLDTITGGGANNNGAFFGKYLSKLAKGTSAGGDPDADSDENGNNMETKDSAGFFASFLMGLLGDMSKSSSGSNPMRRYFGNKPSILF